MYILFHNASSLDQFLTSHDVYEHAHSEPLDAAAFMNHFVWTLISDRKHRQDDRSETSTNQNVLESMTGKHALTRADSPHT
jgi:hypothetical protein